MTRALQNRLALANVKIKNGWENLSIDSIEPQIDQQLNKRKRPMSSADSSMSETSSSVSSRFHSVNGMASSPLTAPMFSDDVPRSGSSYGGSKRSRVGDYSRFPASSNQGGRKTRSAATVQSWKRNHKLPESSPTYHTKHTQFNQSAHVSRLSFISEGTTVPDGAMSPEQSEDDDADLPVLSFNVNPGFHHPSLSENINSSPPTTPSPQRRNITRPSHIPWSRTPRTGDDGADLLMYLATSPTPANGTAKMRIIAPSTPPSKTTPLPSSMMSTPGGTNGVFGFGFQTPSQNFNFADFCNVTPSPAQGNWARTPGTAKTPSAAREARRRLNFDSLMPPTSASPDMARGDGSARKSDLSMELGGALM